MKTKRNPAAGVMQAVLFDLDGVVCLDDKTTAGAAGAAVDPVNVLPRRWQGQDDP